MSHDTNDRDGLEIPPVETEERPNVKTTGRAAFISEGGGGSEVSQ